MLFSHRSAKNNCLAIKVTKSYLAIKKLSGHKKWSTHKMFLEIKAKEVIVNEMKRSDSLLGFASGNVFDPPSNNVQTS